MPTQSTVRVSASTALGALLLVGTIASSHQKAPPITVGREVVVSGTDTLSAYSEYMADIDPEHPERLMACTQPFVPSLNERKNTLHASFDGGKTWALALEDLPVRGGLTIGDPTCIYTFNGVAVLSTLAAHEDSGFGQKSGTWEGFPTGIGQRIYRSTDGGRTWAKPYEIGFMDNQNLMVDRTGGKYHGRIYLHGNVSGDPFWLVYSTDTGKTFTRGELTHVEGNRWAQFDRGTILPDGKVLLPYRTSDKRNPDNPDAPATVTYGVSASTDGGVHLARPDTVAGRRAQCDEMSFPQMAADYSRGPFRGRAYYLWNELEGGGGNAR